MGRTSVRAFEIITEASFLSKPHQYTYGIKLQVSTSKNGVRLANIIKTYVPDFDPSELLTWRPSAPGDTDEIQLGSGGKEGQVQVHFRRPNGRFMTIYGAKAAIQTAMKNPKGEKGSVGTNLGDLSEPVISAAAVAKLIKRGGNRVGDISEADVKAVFNQVVANPQLEFIVADKDSNITDEIKFTMNLREPVMEFVRSPDFWNKYEQVLPSVVHWANSGQLDAYADHFYKNGKADKIVVVSDGLSEQKDRKTDIEAYHTDEHGKERLLKNVNLSLKAGSDKLGQVGGGGMDPSKANYFVKNAAKLFGQLGLGVPEYNPGETKEEYWIRAYESATTQLIEMLKDRNIPNESSVIKSIANMITTNAVTSDPNVKVVSLDPTKGVSTVHSFKNLERKLVSKDIDLTAEYRQGVDRLTKSKARPEIQIKNINDTSKNNMLFKIRYAITTDGTIRNVIEMGPLLRELTTITYKKRGE